MSSLFNIKSTASHLLSRKLPGLSLVELLVSLTIIAILSTIAFVMLQSGRERSLSIRCAANLRQLHTAYMLWAGDNNGTIPLGRLAADESESGNIENVSYVSSPYYQRFVSYLSQGPKLSLPGVTPTTPGFAEPHICPADGPPPSYFGFSYGANGLMASLNQNVASRWTNPSETFFYTDATSTFYFPAGYEQRFAGRHDGRANFIFIDGHLKSLILSDIPSPSPRTGPDSSSFWNAEK